MERRPTRTLLPPLPVFIVLVAGVLMLAGFSVYMAAAGDWGMGSHMSRMMSGGTNSSNAPQTSGSKTESVSIRDFTFTPGNLRVPAGATVTWSNDDSVPHTATSTDGSWDTGTLNTGESKAITFDKAGDYLYSCKVHPNMQARVEVR
jgi:plastocyanin